MTVRLDVIMGRGISLTLRNPNEWTFKHMTAMLCVLGEDPNHLHTLPAQQKSEMMSHVKQQFRSASRRAGTSQEHILKLPPSFSELQREWPQVASGVIENVRAGDLSAISRAGWVACKDFECLVR